MSRAFVKEPDGAEVFEDLPDRVISPNPNLVTARGLSLIETEITRLRGEMAKGQAASNRAAIAEASRDLRYWTSRRGSAQLIPVPTDTNEVRFGLHVTIARDDGRRQRFQIVGQDEGEPSQGRLSYVSPLATALIGRQVGDIVKAGGNDAEIIAIEAGADSHTGSL